MIYTQKEIKEAHGRVSADVENAEKTIKGITLALECQNLVLDHLTSIMEEENLEEKAEEDEEETTEEETTEEDQAKE